MIEYYHVFDIRNIYYDGRRNYLVFGIFIC
jgi:hypothetical protein